MFCPECGKEGEELHQGLCRSCFLKKTHLITCPSEVEVTICAHCNSNLQGGRWKDSDLSDDEIIIENLTENIQVFESAEYVDLSFQIINQRGSRWEVLVEAQGQILSTEVKEECVINVKINRTVCPECSKYASGYYEAVIQLRADKRVLEDTELELADSVMKKLLGKLVEKNRMAYLADKVVLKEGIDYYIGSYKAARSIVNGLKDVLGGIVGESPRLMGRNKSSGKDLYRIWISLRLPNFRKGDFIRKDQFIGRVVNLDGRGILLEDISSLKMYSVPWKQYQKLEKVADSEMVKKTTITNITPHRIQVLHPETYEPIDLDLMPHLADFQIGKEVDVVEIDQNIYVLKKNEKL
ncbi:MAG TPA: 60S ribosomal export protein NMD3 [Methanobacteriaceae archaeon]|nr:60S ribosomal export protein NMD3 [Methanobacteriaceae archaeon]